MSQEKPDCPFCEGRIPELLPVWENEWFYAFEDEFPCVVGHTVVVPKKHVQSLFELGPTMTQLLWAFVSEIRFGMSRAEPEIVGFNIGVNDGSMAGQTIAHAHLHLFPRREGDGGPERFGVRMMFGEKGPYGRKG